MKIAILGGGMSGLIAADTLRNCGFDNIDIYEKDKKAPDPKGFMVLHDNFGYETLKSTIFPVYQSGDEVEYKNKLGYGERVPSSWKSGLNKYYMKGYDPFQLAKMLYSNWNSRITEINVDNGWAKSICEDYDHVFSTIPPKSYSSVAETLETVIFVREGEPKHDLYGVRYNGMKNPNYTRKINLWGKVITEYPNRISGLDLEKVIKPIKVTKYPEFWWGNMIPIGRRGVWNKHIMLHHVRNQIIGMAVEGVLV